MTQFRVLCCLLAVCLLLGFVPAAQPVAAEEHAENGVHAEAGLDQTVQENTTVYLNAGGSHAGDGAIVAYEWEIERPNGTAANLECDDCERTSFRAMETGEYEATLTVTDDEDREATDTMYVTVTEAEAPIVSLSGPAYALAGEEATVEMNAQATDGELSSLVWLLDGEQYATAFLDGNDSTETITVPTDEVGTRIVDMRVTDENGVSAVDRHELTVLEESEFEIQMTVEHEEYEAQETVTPTVAVTNAGPVEDTQEILLEDPDRNAVDSEWITLDAGESATIDDSLATPTLSWIPDNDFAGETHTITAASETDADTATMDIVHPPPYFYVEITGAESVRSGLNRDLHVDVEVTNIGDGPGTQDIVLGVMEFQSEEDSSSLALDSGESGELTLVYEFWNNRAPMNVEVYSEDTNDRRCFELDGEPCDGEDGDGGDDGDSTYPYFDVDANWGSLETLEVGDHQSISVSDITVWPDNHDGHDTVVYSESQYITMDTGGDYDEREITQTVDEMYVNAHGGVDGESGGANAYLSSDGSTDFISPTSTGGVLFCISDDITESTTRNNYGTCKELEIVDDEDDGGPDT